MAEEKKFNKKWLIVIAILVLIVIIVVTVILCLPGNPASAVIALKNEQKNFLLKDANTKQLYTNFEEMVEESDANVYTDELEDIEKVLSNIEVVIDKYADYSTYFEENEYFYNNYHPVTDSLNNLATYKESIINKLKYVNDELDSTSLDFLRESVISVRSDFAEMLSNFETAFSSFNNIFRESYFGFENNLGSQLTFSAVTDYVAVLSDKFDQLVQADTTSSAIADYNYSAGAVVDGFNVFIIMLQLSYQSEFKDYYFDSSISSKYQSINNFYQLYSQTNFRPIINSAYGDGLSITFTLTFEEVEDSAGVYNQLKRFLGGK